MSFLQENFLWITILLLGALLVLVFILYKKSGQLKEKEDLLEKSNALNKELEEARKKADAENAAKTSFLYNISHGMRTPMNAIIGFCDLLEKHQEEPEKREDYIGKINTSSNDLLRIINNILDMTRIESGDTELDQSAWNISQFYDNVTFGFEDMMEEKGIEFTSQVVVQNPYVHFDAIKLREIIVNIISNAYKYTNSGGSVNVHLEEIDSEREGYAYYQTIITDTGSGISEKFLPFIFEEFSRVSKTKKNEPQGSSLGLPIVKRLIEFMDGTVEVHSKRGNGTTFIITMPFKIADKAHLINYDEDEIDPDLFEGKRILLAEDNDLNAEIAIEILTEAGFIVERGEDGNIVVNMLEQSQQGYYDLILMDIQMPNMNGYEATETIRAMKDSTKSSIPILAMTANAFEEDKNEATRAGMNGFLAKPINVRELMKMLASQLSESN